MLPGGRRAPGGWGLGSGTVDPTPDSEKGGQDGPAGEGTGSTPQSQSPHKGPLCPAGGKCGRPQRRRRPAEGGQSEGSGVGQVGALGGGPVVPPLRRSCRSAGGTGQRGRPTFGRCRRWPRHCPLSLAGAGSPARRLPAAASCSRNAANGALGVGRAAEPGRRRARGEGRRGGRECRRGPGGRSSAAPARFSRAAHSI